VEYSVINKSRGDKELLNKLISNMLTEYSRQLYGFTKSELDSMIEYDILNIMSFYYSKMDAKQKHNICLEIESVLGLSDIEGVLDNLSDFADELYIPLACKLIDRLGDTRVTIIIYETLFTYCKIMVVEHWNQFDSFANYMALLNAAYFNALAYKFHIRDSYKACLAAFYGAETYDDLVENLYEKNLENLGWDADVELDVLDQLIEDSKRNNSFETGSMEEFSDAVSLMEDIRLNHDADNIVIEDKEGFELIVQKTGIREAKSDIIHGFECHFCEAKFSDTEYIIVYQKETRINEIIDKDDEWAKFQKDLYYADIKNGKYNGMVYIIYILDNDSNNIPIQVIESNRTYGRKYVFTEDEAITFINGIVKTSNDEIASASPVQEWDRILREEHLTGCMTEAYAAKKVENYLNGERFDADYVYDDDFSMMTKSSIPQIKWVKSLDARGFRRFCLDDNIFDFGQINLFYGANGSGKTSILEAIEYALTADVRRVKDFKVKMPAGREPKLYVYDKEAGVHTFNPEFSKKNSKEIERVWYGVPAGRNKTTLSDNFNRFNAFDSEAAYKFIHESDNSEESYASMFGNLMFGETVVDHEKKWQRFKRAFNEKYAELREELNNARSMADYYEETLKYRSEQSQSEQLEKGIVELKYKQRLPREASERYEKLFEELTLIRKYVDILASHELQTKKLIEIIEEISQVKNRNLMYVKQRKDKNEEITHLAKLNGEIKEKIFSYREQLEDLRERLERINVDVNNWRIVQNVLSHTDTIKLVESLEKEKDQLNIDLYNISLIEQRPAIISFLKLDSHSPITMFDRRELETELQELQNKKIKLENEYDNAKKNFGLKEQHSIELRKMGKLLLVDAKCPLCGQEYTSQQQLLEIIENSVIVDDNMEELISSIQTVTKRIVEIEEVLEREELIEKAFDDLDELSDKISLVEKCCEYSEYSELLVFIMQKANKEKRKQEIIEQQATLDSQGFSLSNIMACKEFKSKDPSYLRFVREGEADYSNYLSKRLDEAQRRVASVEDSIARSQKQIQQNENKEELLRNEIHRIDSVIDGIDIDSNRELEQAIETIKTKFDISEDTILKKWIELYHTVYDKCELENERISSQGSIAFDKQMLSDYRATIKRVEPQVARCARAIQAFEKMPSLSSFVEQGIKSNIQQISKFFKWMHHSGEFEELGIDEGGIYAIRGLNNELIRTYQMSTGQRSTIAMSVMFALYMAAPEAPQFLLLDEPLATMDDTQVLNVLDILKSMAEQGTQIFFTTANGIMIKLFKECFKNTDFDYKEYQFIKRINSPSEVISSSVNDTKTIEELTLDDLTLDFNQFAQIRQILKKNQEKLIADDEWEIVEDKKELSETTEAKETKDNFFTLLSDDEIEVLKILLFIGGESAIELRNSLAKYPMYKVLFETVNEKAIDFFGETVVENDDELPWMEEFYIDEIKAQYEKFLK